jgi:exonuclease III
VLALQELRRDLTGWRSQRLLVGGAPPENDSASGVALVLSDRAAQRVECRGENEGSRIVWVRLRGCIHDLVIIGVYIPHHARLEPARSETLAEVQALAKALCTSSDCLIIMGDFNSRMARARSGITGKYCMHKTTDRGGEIMHDMCADLQLVAASTRFCPGKQPLGCATYISNKWRKPNQIDYVLVNKRWMHSVTNSRVDWRHSLMWFAHGRKFDHGLLQITFRFRIRKLRISAAGPDHTPLKDQEVLAEFEKALPEPPKDGHPTVVKELTALKESIEAACVGLPRKDPIGIAASRALEQTRGLCRERKS